MNYFKTNLKLLFICTLGFTLNVSANDSTGYIGTGGIQYLKNDQISMQSEDLFISKKLIQVDYQFKNLSNKDIIETVLFPLPQVNSHMESDFADTSALIRSFKIKVNGQSVQPKVHTRAFMQPLKKNGELDWEAKAIDVTEAFKACGLTEQELLSPWLNNGEFVQANQKIYQCNNPKIKTLIKSYDHEDNILWSSQVIYSWQQTFKANSVTKVHHQYQPLVGGSVALYPDEYNQQFCMDKAFKQGLKKANAQHAPFSALSYILTTGANWAKPIEKFRLVVERDKDELVSFCWDGKVKKLNATQFEMTKSNFLPKRDLDIIFVRRILD